MDNLEQKILSHIVNGNASLKQKKDVLALLEEKETSKPSNAHEFIDTKGAMAQLGGLSRTKLWFLRRNGLPTYRIGAKLLFRPSEISSWIQEHQKDISKLRNKTSHREEAL